MAPMSSRKVDTVLAAGDDVVIAGPTAAIVSAKPVIGTEIDADEILRAIPGNVVDVLIDNRQLHGRTMQEIADRVGDNARGVFLRSLTRMGREVPLSPETQFYVGDVMTLVGSTRNIDRAASKVGQVIALRRPHRHRLPCRRYRRRACSRAFSASSSARLR